MTITFDCWKKLVFGPGVERVRAALTILMVFAVCSVLVSAVYEMVPESAWADMVVTLNMPAVILTGLVTILKVSQ